MNNLTQRVLTAAVLIPLVLLALFVDPTSWSILALATFAGAFAHYEFLRIVYTDGDAIPTLLAYVTVGLGAAIVVLATAVDPNAALGVLVAATLLIGGLSLQGQQNLKRASSHMLKSLASLLYVPTLVAIWPLLKAHPPASEGAVWLLLTLMIAFLSDTMAYFAGRAFGKHKLLPTVSPKKTWEGSIGGVFGGIFAMVGAGSFWLLPKLPIHHAILLGALGSMCGQIGDLVESLFKRAFGVKDSGNLLPGHGGMLDRVDGLLFTAPVVYAYIQLMQP